MIDQNIILNTCFQFIAAQAGTVSIVKYSHIIPVILSLVLGIFVFIKAKQNLFSKIFLLFIITFSIWLIGDLLVWTSTNYILIYTSWSILDLFEIIFYILGLYFVLVFIDKKDINIFKKVLLFLLLIPAFYITLTNQSLLGFNQSFCEAIGNDNLSIYKLIVEVILLLIMFYYILIPFLKKYSWQIKKTNLIMAGSMFLFLIIFGITEYIASTTGVYEINLYSLFLLPIFLISIIYSVFELDIFHFDIIGTHYLVVGLFILITGQLFFVNGATDQLLTIITVIVTLGLSILLFKNLKKESDQRVKIENLSKDLENSKMRLEKTNIDLENANDKLKSLDKLKTEFVSLASHQLRSPLTAIKGYTSMLIEGDYGDIQPEAKKTIEKVMESSNNLTLVVEDLLNVSKIESGGMKYEMVNFDFADLARDTAEELSVTAEKKNLKLINNVPVDKKYIINGDKEKLRQVLINLIDNSMKYTKEGQIDVSLEKKDNKIILSIKDTGVGISKEAIGSLFQKFSRGEGAKLNSSGSGLGLYLVKEIVKAHNGRVWIESEGVGKGSTFSVELEEVK